jgi:hypothetical protein
MAERPEDVTASLGLGVSLDHAISMTLPTLGGLVWMRYGHMWVFVGGGVLALITAAFAGMIRLPHRPAVNVVAEPSMLPGETTAELDG